MTRLLPLAVVLLVPLAAQAQDLKPAPEYYLEAAVAFTAAEAVARACPTLSVDPVAVTERSGVLLDRLQADGFDTSRADAGMEDPTADLTARLVALLRDKHGLKDGATQDAVCAAGRAEMVEGGALSGLLVEVSG